MATIKYFYIFLRDQFLPLLNTKFFWMISEMLVFLGEMQKNWLEKPSVEQNNHAFPKWSASMMLIETIPNIG